MTLSKKERCVQAATRASAAADENEREKGLGRVTFFVSPCAYMVVATAALLLRRPWTRALRKEERLSSFVFAQATEVKVPAAGAKFVCCAVLLFSRVRWLRPPLAFRSNTGLRNIIDVAFSVGGGRIFGV